MEFIIIGIIVVFVVTYRLNKGTDIYAFMSESANTVYNKFAPYSFKTYREKIQSLGMDFTKTQYLVQVILFAGGAGAIAYLYFYNIVTVVIYAIIATMFIPYLTYLRYKKIYSEFLFEQVQVYTTNTIMEFNTVQSFVKALEGVYESGVLEDPVKGDLKTMIEMAYQNGSIDESIKFMNEKYDYHIVRNIHQLFLQITNEGSKDSSEALNNLLIDIDMLVSSVYADRIDRDSFHRTFVNFGIGLYGMVMLVQFLVGNATYMQLLGMWYIQFLLHAVIAINTYFLLSGEKYYYENVGAE